MTDDELMVRGAQGNEEAFRLLVQRWERPVFLSHNLFGEEAGEGFGRGERMVYRVRLSPPQPILGWPPPQRGKGEKARLPLHLLAEAQP